MATEPGVREQPKHSAGSNEHRPWWRRVGVWVGGVAAAALATILTTNLTHVVDWFAVSIDTVGEPVDVRFEIEERVDDVVLPPTSTLSDDEIAVLDPLPAPDEIAWLQEHEDGDITGTRSVVLTLRGNRAETVRITDLRSEETCSPIERGTLVRATYGRGAGVDSERVNIDVGDGPSGAYVVDETTGTPRPYFPDRTITLARDEEFVMIVDLQAGVSGETCAVALELTVWEGDTRSTQRIPGEESWTFAVTDIELDEVEAEYGAVHLGGGVCQTFVPATPGWANADLEAACGPGNVAPWP